MPYITIGGGNTLACPNLSVVDILKLIRKGAAAMRHLATSTAADCFCVQRKSNQNQLRWLVHKVPLSVLGIIRLGCILAPPDEYDLCGDGDTRCRYHYCSNLFRAQCASNQTLRPRANTAVDL